MVRAMCLLIVLGCGFLAGCGSEFRDTREITFIRKEPRGPIRSISITNPAEVKRIADTIVLIPKQPCLCEHFDEAIFVTPNRTIRASVCDHCFDVGMQTSHMPEDFWKLFQAYIAVAPVQTRPASGTAPAGPSIR